jgi:prolyl-tRNA editing enzyme YbaK/EbsC (Cys-tRNA(Pro) deacylase)
MSAAQRLWGYQPDGSARLFLVPVGGKLPAGWSPDVNVIIDPALRTGEKICAAAGASAHNPVPASQEAKVAVKADAAAAQKAATSGLRYDADNHPVPPPKQRVG